MLLFSVISMSVATLILAIIECFFKKHKAVSFSLQFFTLITLILTTFTVAHYKNNFSLFSIFLIVSIVPQFLTVFDFEKFFGKKKQTNIDLSNEEVEKNTKNFIDFKANGGLFVKSLGIFATSVFLVFCGLYLGKETIFSFLLAISIALFSTFILLLKKKNLNLFYILSHVFLFAAIGLSLAHILTVLLYSFNLTNILFSVGLLAYAVYCLVFVFTKNKYSNLIYLLSVATMISTILI